MKKIIMLTLTAYTLSLGHSFGQNIYTIAGNGDYGYSGDGYPANSRYVEFNEPLWTYLDAAGNLYIADEENNVIRKINSSGIISTFAGNQILGGGYSGDGGAATAAQLNLPWSVVEDRAGNIYIGDAGNYVIRMVNTSGIVSTIAGTGTLGFSGDGVQATNAELNFPTGIAVDSMGNVYFSDIQNCRIREINTSGIISSIAGNGIPGYTGDGGLADTTELDYPQGIYLDSIGNIYFADYGGSSCRIRKINTSGIVNTLAGNGKPGYTGDGGLADTTELYAPVDVNFDKAGNMYISDEGNDRIRKVSTSGIITTIAGNGYRAGGLGGFSGDGGPATNAELDNPRGVSIDPLGNIFFSDFSNNRIREITNEPLGINTIYSNGILNIYPNPATQNLTILLTGLKSGLVSLSIMDLTGRVIMSFAGNINIIPKQIDISFLTPGMYLIAIKTNDSFITQKFIKQ